MMTHPWVELIVAALTDFVISAGGALLAAMTATGSADVPGKGSLIAAVVTGLVAAAMGVKKQLAPQVRVGEGTP